MRSIQSAGLVRAVVAGLVLAGGVAAVPTASASSSLVVQRGGSLELSSSAGVTSTREQVPVVVDPALRLTGSAERIVRGAVVRITEGASKDDVLSFDGGQGIRGSFAGRRLRLSGAAPASAYERALRSVEFVHEGDEPGSPTTTRSIRFKLLDQGGAAASKTIQVVAVDDAPQVTMTAGALELAAGTGAVALDPGLRIVEPDSASLTGATVTVRGGVAGASNDVLGFAAARGITGSTNEAGVLTLSGAASVAAYEAVLRQITYRNTGTTAGERVVEVVVRDTSMTPGSATRRVRLTAATPTEQPVARDDVASMQQGAGAIRIAVLANDTAPAGSTLRVVSVTQPLQGFVTTDGTTVSYQPAANHCNSTHGLPTYPFTYTLATGQSATVRVSVTCIDKTPIPAARDDVFDIDEDAGNVFPDIFANDTVTSAEDRLATQVTQPRYGESGRNKGGGVYYRPNADYCNSQEGGTPDTFTYTLVGGLTATVSMRVTCVDDAPTAVADSFTVLQDAGATTLAVDANDTDVDGGPRQVTSTTQPANGSVTLVDGAVAYAPKPGYCNSGTGNTAGGTSGGGTIIVIQPTADTFTYTLSGGSTAVVSVQVTCEEPTTAAPQANNDEYSARFGSAFVQAPGLLANDTAGEGETLRVVGCVAGTSDPPPGQFSCNGFLSTLTVSSDGSLSFSSSLAIDLRETFTYAIEDSRGRRSTARVVIIRHAPFFPF